MKYRKLFYALIPSASLLLFGCINLGPKYEQPDLGIQIPGSYAYAPAGIRSPAADDRWWTAFEDGELDRLVEEVIKNNWDIKQAAARVLEAPATQQVAEQRYVRGLVIYLDVLNAQITRYQAEDNLVLVDLALMKNRVELHRALGSGWAAPNPVAREDDGIFFRF